MYMACCCEQVRAKALAEEEALAAAIDFVLNNFHQCMAHGGDAHHGIASDTDEAAEVPACLEDDQSPAVDVLIAMASR